MWTRRNLCAVCWSLALTAVTVSGAAASEPFVLEEAETAAVDDGRSTAATVWFQGFLANDETGDPINASYNVVARIYTAAGGGTLLWGPETHSSVAITEGWFNIELGSIMAPLPTFASPPYYLSLQVNGEYLTPRLKLASVPSALQSATSDLLPFSATYAGTADAFLITANQASSADAINIDRNNSLSSGYCIFARNDGNGQVFRGYQGSTTATDACVADFDIAYGINDSPVVEATTAGSGAAYHGVTNGLYAVQVYADGTDGVAASEAHVIHAVYNGAERTGDNIAVYGEALDDAWGIGGEFKGEQLGVRGTAVAPAAGGTICVGVSGISVTSNTGENVGVWGQASSGAPSYAGLFVGNVDVAGTLTKNAGSFRIDHPLDPANKYLSHSFVESPDMMNIYNGNVELGVGGDAWVELPEWFEALNQDFRYQLTCLGAFAPVFVADGITGNRFHIAGGEPGQIVSWQVTGVRHDPYAEAHRIPVEEEKLGRERGRYRNPELHGAPASAGVLYELEERGRQAAARRADRPEDPPDGSVTE